ncbi:NAD(P)H-dependent oxidoreductase [Algivirga pacifica]|uniref:NAD(P)H-dependent oxidoreductase n=1 Tax=Algivirga pacifica TaxID=1162670 RepID=A0ABP9D4W0_9BACT
MKILHLVFHPNLQTSRVNKIWKEQLEESNKITTSRDMYQEYPDFKIDVAREQELLLEHDRIVIQFPLYWYSVTPLLKQWLDDVLTYNFAYGSKGDKLKGKDLQIILSVGGQEKYYSGFDKFSTIHELLQPFVLTANLTQMNYLIPVWMYGADAAEEETIRKYGNNWVDMIDDRKRSNPIAYLNEQMNVENDEYYEE